MLNEFSPNDKVLILGDGDFSFAKALITANSNLNITATVFDNEASCHLIYSESERNATILRTSGVKVHFGIDATNLPGSIVNSNFDRIVFNFPHCGGKTNLKKCKLLLKGAFICCSKILSKDGRIYLTLAHGQSGIDCSDDAISLEDRLPDHNMDSWQAIYLSPYGDLVLEKVLPFDVERLQFFVIFLRNRCQKFRIENSQTLVFRPATSINPQNLCFSNEDGDDGLTNFRPFYIHDVAFWVNRKLFDQNLFSTTCRRYSKGLIKRITFLPEYSLNDDRYAGRNLQTLCFRLIWQSNKFSLPRENCRDLQNLLRTHLMDVMPKTLSFMLRG